MENQSQNFINLEEDIQKLLEKYPNIERMDVVYKQNSISQYDMNILQKMYDTTQCKVVNNEHTEEFASYFRLEYPKFSISTSNEVGSEMSEADKLEEKAIERFEDERQN